ncbi:hypothetical protein BD324DRAFT_587298 [Kockovaella imperatae]|uniref:Probable endonuclease LCL3 n=1 Tax=Kockovaella imperatae TaxID=4999 RepID=A0A1Y1UQ52_9TREE|nr:hypothetical protein BD324DRAFT_587298 [Kockovaella imperatae]ORX40102.1 hypothetical protein BD324DRAFT_587298 [Kockovaella imperatae]
MRPNHEADRLPGPSSLPSRIGGPSRAPPPGYLLPSPLESITNLLPSFGSPKSSSASSTPTNSSSWPFASGSKDPSKPSKIDELLQNPAAVGLLSAVAALGIAGGGWYGYRVLWKRVRNVNDVTGPMLEKQRWIKGVVTSVGDGDNFRVFHTPGPFYRWPFKLRSVPSTSKELKDQTLHIRIAAVDAPENAHFGNPAQPYAKESWDWMKQLVTGKRVRVQLIRKDQYLRIVGVPYLSRFILPDKPIPLLMLKEGMGVVYESAGAEYGPWSVDYLKQLEAEARRAKKGMWGLKGKFEHPADYKKRMKIGGDEPVVTASPRTRRKKNASWLGRLLFWK